MFQMKAPKTRHYQLTKSKTDGLQSQILRVKTSLFIPSFYPNDDSMHCSALCIVALKKAHSICINLSVCVVSPRVVKMSKLAAVTLEDNLRAGNLREHTFNIGHVSEIVVVTVKEGRGHLIRKVNTW